MGFEPTRAEHIGLAVQHLNHSVTSSACYRKVLKTYLIWYRSVHVNLQKVFSHQFIHHEIDINE